MANTWMRFFPEVHIFTDSCNENSIKSFMANNTNTNLIIHETPTFSHYLVGSSGDYGWSLAQNRHLKAISTIFELYPNKKLYFFADDDSYIFPNNLLEEFSTKDLTIDNIYGQLFISFKNIQMFFSHPESLPVFAQGGAGIAITHSLISKLVSYLDQCALVFCDTFFASDMRISACIDRFLNLSVSSHDKNLVFKSMIQSMHGDTPQKTMSAKLPPITYHHVVDDMVMRIHNATYSRWNYQGTEYYTDWSKFSLILHQIETPDGFLADFDFGYALYSNKADSTLPFTYSISQLEPVFSKNEQNKPIKYYQNFTNGLSFIFECDDDYLPGEISFDHFGPAGEYVIFGRANCPKPQTYKYHYPQGTNYKIFKNEAIYL